MNKYRIKLSKSKAFKKKLKAVKQYSITHWKRLMFFSLLFIGAVLLIRQFTQEPKGITTQKAEKKTLVTTFSANGEVRAKKMADLKFYSPGNVVWVGVKNGDSVRAYQGVASLNRVALNSAYQQALNNLRRYDATVASTYDQLQNKEKTETFAEKDLRTTAEVAKDNAYDAIIAAKDALNHAVLVSPIAGVVVDTNNVIAGLNLTGSDLETKFIRIVDLKSLYFEVEIDEVDYAKIKLNQEASIQLDAYPDTTCSGKVSFLGKNGEKSTGGVVTFPAEISFEKCELDLGVFLNGQANFILSKQENMLLIPKTYLVQKNGSSFVWKQTGKTTKQRKLVPVKTGQSNSNEIEIIEGLSENDVVVFIP